MVQSPTPLRCPNCQSQIQAAIEQLLDVGSDPAAKARLLSGTFNLIQCSVCGFKGQIATPLVYHDPNHELLLTFMPVEINIPKEEQERVIGQMINTVTNRLPAEQRKGYLLQPHAVLTMQSLIERVLEADGITKEEIEGQRERMRLFEDLLRTPEHHLNAFIADHDERMDAAFFQLASLTVQSTDDARAREALNQRVEIALRQSTFGKKIKAQEEELQAAVESLNELGEKISRENLLTLFIDAPGDDRVVALVNLTRPALDYSFFQLLTERIDASEDEEHARLVELRSRILEITQQIDKVQEARASQAADLLQSLIKAEDLDQALPAALPLVDDFFLGILQANIQAAEEREDEVTLSKLEEIRSRLQELAEESIPPGIRLAQELLNITEQEHLQKFLEESADAIDDQTLGALMATAESLEERGEQDGASQIRELYRQALRFSMKAKMKKKEEKSEPST
ncbi:MAG: hypothetical protein GTO14_15410 [Anaerolineales bacterium]|nr:hypothetical protein [Anaerolineales bacterium]